MYLFSLIYLLLKEVIPSGISKINIDTAIRLAITRNIREFFFNNPEKIKSSKIYDLLMEKPESFEYRYYLQKYINELQNNKLNVCELKDIVPLIKKGVKEIVLTASIEFGSVGDAKYIK